VEECFDTIVIGAGQAGLATGYYLSQNKQKYVILEQSSTIASAWLSRWDSFSLVLPNWTLQMPEFPYQGEEPDGFLSKDEIIKYFERFAATFNPDIRFRNKVIRVEKNPVHQNFLVHTSDHIYETANVVVATGTFQKPKIPPFSKNLSEEITQLHTSEYRNPQELPEGAILVVGSGQSGCQIAEELYQSGRKAYLCVGGATRLPRFYRGKDSIFWLREMNFFDQTVDTLESPKERFSANPFLSGKGGGRSLDLHQFAKDGVILLGHMRDAKGKKIFLLPDLKESLSKIDDFVVELKKNIDKFIETHNIEAEEESVESELSDGFDFEIIEELDLEAAGIKTIIWATGFRFNFSWVKFPVADEYGYPIQTRGVSEIPGLYFSGLHWLYKRRSGLPWGVGEDAAHIVEHLINRTTKLDEQKSEKAK
jgi:putative flavoprotein involved in K+ transport